MARMTGTGGERRRRVLSEQMKSSATQTSAIGSHDSSGKDAGPLYAEEALSSQPRITDLVPRRYSTLLLLESLGALSVVGLVAIHAHLPEIGSQISSGQIRAFDLAASGSLAAWFSSFVFAASAVLSLVIHSVRRHRLDDYHGRYRIWKVTAALWLVMSVLAVAPLHGAASDALLRLTGMTGALHSLLAWLVPAAVVVGFVIIRLAMDMRACRLAVTAFFLTALGWSAAIVIDMDLFSFETTALAVMTGSACLLSGHVFLLSALLLGARHVLLDAEGVHGSSHRDRRQKEIDSENDAETPKLKKGVWSRSNKSGTKHKIDAAHPRASESEIDWEETDNPVKNHGNNKSATTQWVDGSEAFDEQFEDDGSQNRRLSKSERKRLRKQKARQERAERRV